MPPSGLLSERGTAVRLKVQNALSPLLDPGFLEGALRRHFQPLLDPSFDEFLAGHYSKDVAIHINGEQLDRHVWSAPLHAPLAIRFSRKRKPSALGYLIRQENSLPEEMRGLGISTYNKVIRRGWDWLGMTPMSPQRIGGVIEVPELAACLTLNKGDFIRTGARGAIYLAFRKAIQEAVSRQLAAWGDAPASTDEAPPREVRPLQRDLVQVLEDLAVDFPLLSSLVEHRFGGQKRLSFGQASATESRAFVAGSVAEQSEAYADQRESTTSQQGRNGDANHHDTPATEPVAAPGHGLLLPAKGAVRRPGHYALDIQFEDQPETLELAHLMESTVWVNRAHPAYRRAVVSRSIGYHIALAVAMALAPLAVESADEHTFVSTFLFRWGEIIGNPATRKQKKR